MKKLYLTICYILFDSILNAQTTTFEWAKSMGGDYGLATGIDIAVDNFNNVYTTGTFEGKVDFDPDISGVFNLTTSGYANRDIFISKFDNSGNFIWARQISGSSNNYEYPSSIVLDGSGNVYLTGYFKNTIDFDPGPGVFNLTSSGFCSFILKLNSSGNFVWVKQLGGGFGDVKSSSLTLDIAGNIYTTGNFWHTADFDPGPGIYNLTPSGTDAFISRLDSSGNFVWARGLASASSSNYTYGNSIAIDIWGYVYTTGYFTGTTDFDPGAGTYNLTVSGGQDAFISKLNSSGNFMWAKQLGGSDIEIATSIIVDYTGTVFTTGYFKYTADFDPGPSSFNLVSAGYTDIFISELDAAGNFIWAGKIGGPYDESPSGISLDATGNIILAGNFSDSCDFDPHVSGTFVLNGTSGSVFASKLTASGNLMWAKQFGSPGTTLEIIKSHSLDVSGNIYTTGYFSGTADFNPDTGVYNLTGIGNCSFTSQLNSSGNFVWAKSAGKSAGIFNKSVATDPSGNILAAGNFYGAVDFDPGPGVFNLMTTVPEKDIFIYKSDASGNFAWAKQLVGTADDAVNGLATDSLGNNYITGSFQGTIDFDPGPGSFVLTPSIGVRAIFIAKYDAFGSFIWARKIDDPSGFQFLINSNSITIDKNRKILVTGGFYGTIDFDPGPATYNLTATNSSVFILKLDESGNFVWVKQFSGGSGGGSSISTDAAGNILSSGEFFGTMDFDPGASTFNLSSASIYTIYISKLSSSGNFIWAKKIDVNLINNMSGYDYSFALAVDHSGNVYSSGSFTDTTDFDPGTGVYNLSAGYIDIYILKLDAGGNFVWVKQFAGGNNSRSRSMAADAFGNIYTTGYFNSSPDFDPDVSGTFYLPSLSTYTTFISKLNTSGNFVRAYNVGGLGGNPESNHGYSSISLDQSGNIYTGGSFAGGCDFNPDSGGTFYISSVGNPDLFIHKISQCPWANITPAGSISFCTGGSVTLNANTGTGFTYQWKKNGNNISGATSASYTATTAGNYSVVVSSSCGTATSTVVTVTINALPSSTITPSGPTIFCSGSSVLLNAPTGTNYSYQWKKGGVNIPGATNSNYTATASGTYKVTVTNTNTGCSKTTPTGTVVTVNVLPPATISPSGTIVFCAGQSAVLTANPGAGYSYQWRKNHGAVNGATSQAYTVSAAGKYRVQVTDSNGCVKLSNADTVVVPCKEGENGDASEEDLELDVIVFPNPSSGDFVFEIQNAKTEKISINVYDVIGKEVESENTFNSKFIIRNSQLTPGIYSAEVTDGNNRKVFKLIKSK